MSFRHAVLALLALLLPSTVTWAEFVEVSVVELDDGWFGYTYSFEGPVHHGLVSFHLEPANLKSVRNIRQPFDFMYRLGADRLSWARDALDPDRDYLGEVLQFSFESASPSGTASYRVQAPDFLAEGEIAGPTPLPTLTTPEPTGLALVAIGGLAWICTRRRKREPVR